MANATDAWGNPWGRSRPRNMERPLPDYPAGRRCSVDSCATILNGYNPGPECLRHAPELPWDRELEELVAEKVH